MARTVAACVALALAASISSAEAQRATQVLSAASAQTIVDGCRKHAEGLNKSQGIAVYDTGGNLVAALRMDRNSAAIMQFASEKAKAAALWGFPTSAMENIIKAAPGFAQAPNVVGLPGGLPIYTADGKTLLGGAGASGESSADDVACIEAGIKVAGLASSRPAPPAQK